MRLTVFSIEGGDIIANRPLAVTITTAGKLFGITFESVDAGRATILERLDAHGVGHFPVAFLAEPLPAGNTPVRIGATVAARAAHVVLA